MSNNFFAGPAYLVDGFKLLYQPGIKRYVFIPLVINLIFFVGLFSILWYFMGEFNSWFAQHIPTWLQWLSAVLWLLFFVSFFIIFIYTFVIVANLIAAPFNSLLSEKISEHLTGKANDNRTLMENIRDVPRIIGRQFSLVGYYLPRAVALLILFFVPFIQAVAPFLWFIFNAWFMTLTYVDYPTDNQRIPLSVVYEKLRRKRWLNLGFGSSVLIISMVPIFNLFVMPAAVAGATKLWLEQGN